MSYLVIKFHIAALILLIFGVISGSQSGWASANAIAPLILGTLTFATFFFYESMIPSSVAAMCVTTI